MKKALGRWLWIAAVLTAWPAAAEVPTSTPTSTPGLLLYDVPRASMIPGTPGMPGGFHFMLNAFAEAQNVGLGAHRIENQGVGGFNGGDTYPLLVDDWAMASYRDERGWVEGLLMLDFEPLSIGPAGFPELGQSGEGLWDAQHAHQLLHQAMVAVHPLAGLPGWHPESMREEGPYDLSLFGGQGSATIGPPIFMHRGSSPGPTVPRKHHKGENPHETFPVLGASLRLHETWLEASAFSDLELTPQDSRFYPHVAPPESFAARVRQYVDDVLELQLSAERQRDQGHGEPDAWQVSASAYGWGWVHGWRLDALVDWALDAPDPPQGQKGQTAQALLGELATRTPSLREVAWLRSEYNQREEPASRLGVISSPWLFETLGYEHVVVTQGPSGLQLGVFGEGTVALIPPSLEWFYGTHVAVTLNVGLHVTGMWMTDSSLRPMMHM
ncbi:MAG: hypothetical protein ACRENE_19855 [Polyangiaceae bacterium]